MDYCGNKDEKTKAVCDREEGHEGWHRDSTKEAALIAELLKGREEFEGVLAARQREIGDLENQLRTMRIEFNEYRSRVEFEAYKRMDERG